MSLKIYLLAKERFEGVENLILSRIKFHNFFVDLKEFDALLCTSKNALKALERLNLLSNDEILVYAVGEKTANYALNLGFKNVKNAKKTYGLAFFDEFKKELKDKKCLYLRGLNTAFDLSKSLKKEGVSLKELVVYENVFYKRLKSLARPAIFVFTSPLSVENFLQIYSLNENDKAVVIGQSTAKRLSNFKNLFISEKQSIKECVNLAKSLL